MEITVLLTLGRARSFRFSPLLEAGGLIGSRAEELTAPIANVTTGGPPQVTCCSGFLWPLDAWPPVGSSGGLNTMRLRRDEIDPQVAHKLSAFLRERWDRSRAEVSRAWSVLCARIAPLAVPLLLTAAIPGLFPLFPLFALLAMLGVWLGGIVYFRRAVPRRGATDVLTSGTVRLASEARSLTPLEKGYAALLQALLSSSPFLGEDAVRGMLPPLNELLQNARDLDTQQQRLLVPVGDTAIASLVQQRDGLARRVEQSTDSVARQTMQESLELCEARLEDLRQLGSHVARLDAQRELISQMFASLQTSLARLQTTPASLAALDVDELRRSVVHLSQQARAVEQAIQEVTTLRQV